jgi:hypothetical protein
LVIEEVEYPQRAGVGRKRFSLKNFEEKRIFASGYTVHRWNRRIVIGAAFRKIYVATTQEPADAIDPWPPVNKRVVVVGAS